MLFDSTKTPLISSLTKRDNVKCNIYKSIGKKDLSNEVTLEFPERFDSFTQVSDITKEVLKTQDEFECKHTRIHIPLVFKYPFRQYFRYILNKDYDGYYRSPTCPLDWFRSDSFLY